MTSGALPSLATRLSSTRWQTDYASSPVQTTSHRRWRSTSGTTSVPGRGAGPHRIRPSVRARDVPGLGDVASGQHIALLQAAGAVVNATTWFDRTNYFETLPTGGLDLALWLEADRMGTLLDALTQENLDNQREVVKEEKRQRYDNVPYGDVMELVNALTFPGRPSVRAYHDRLDGGPRCGHAGGCPCVLPAPLRAEQRRLVDRGRCGAG